MAQTARPANLTRTLKELRANPEKLPWRERRELVRQLGEVLQKGDAGAIALQLVRLLAADPKGEVRAEVAELLAWLPERDFLKLAGQLSGDDNAFVSHAAARALSRRRKGEHEAERRQEGLDEIQADYADMAKIHGDHAAGKARKMAERLYDVLVGATVHNMRGIITPVQLHITTLQQRLKAGDVDTATTLQTLEKMRERLALLERLMSNMRAYSRVPSGKRQREPLARLVHEAVTLVKDALSAVGKEKNGVTVQVEVPDDLLVSVSKDAIVMALFNLVKNAYDAFPERVLEKRRGVIVIRTRELDGDRIELVVSDNGVGMNAEELTAVLRLNPGQTTLKRDGTGFGLPIAQRYVAAHNGTLKVVSRENDGTTITVMLPKESEGSDDE